MNRYQHSKSGLFLMELLVNLLLFCLLCGCGLLFFIKSNHLIKDATSLHNGVSITSSVAAIYAQGDGTLEPICALYETATVSNDTLYLYLDEDYKPCTEKTAAYLLRAKHLDTTPAKLQIDFCDREGNASYSIRACNYSTSTLKDAKEVASP